MQEVPPTKAPSHTIDRDGLTILYSPELAIVDIVFVHGLQGHPRRTWACRKTGGQEDAVNDSGDAGGTRQGIKKLFSRRSRSGSGTRDTVSSTADEVFWPLDLLPLDCKQARIMTWGYDTKVATFFARGANQSNIAAHSKNLLHALKRKRLGAESVGRKLIFVAHSLGGILVKDLLSRAASYNDPIILDIFTATKGVVFLGTPHRGSRKAGIGEIARKIASVTGQDTNDQNLRALVVNGGELERIHEDFVKLYLQKDCQFQVKSFQESRGLLGVSYFGLNERIVEPFSSTFIGANEHIESINADHMSMCRFSSREDDGYQKITGEILLLVAEVEAQLQVEELEKIKISAIIEPSIASGMTVSSIHSLNEVERKCVALLTQNTASAAEYKYSLPTRVEGTCQWVVSSPQYMEWNREVETCLLWIIGYPGSGKTILSAYLLEYLNDGETSPVTKPSRRDAKSTCYFFCDEKIKTQRDGTAILRSIIHQLLLRRRLVLKYLKDAYGILGQNFDQNFNELWKVFIDIASDKKVGAINVIVDAMDECEPETRDQFLRCIMRLIERTKSTKGPHTPRIKFLITSRPLPGLQSTSNQLMIDPSRGSVENDLRLVIQARIEGIARRTHCTPEARVYLENALNAKADRTFLWVTLLLHLLEKSYLASKRHFESIVDELPQDLTATYERFLHGIEAPYQSTAIKILHLLVGSSRPLTLEEMRVLLALQSHHKSLHDVEADAEPNIRETIEGILGPLVRIWDSQIFLVHQSLKEFLLGLAEQHDNPLCSMYGVDLKKANLVLCDAAVNYLLLDDFRRDIFLKDAASPEQSPTSLKGLDNDVASEDFPWDPYTIGEGALFVDPVLFEAEMCETLKKTYNLFDYAATQWAQHFALCDGLSPQRLLDLVRELSDATKDVGLNWFRYYWLRSGVDMPYPRNFIPVLTASFFGHIETLEHYLQAGRRVSSDCEERAIYWAAQNGHKRLFKRLLEEDVRPDLEVVNGQTALVIAAQFDRVEVVKLILNHQGGSDQQVKSRINHTTHRGRTSLSLAAGSGFHGVVELLLQHQSIQPDLPDYDGWTPIFWAISGRHLDIVQTLLTHPRVSVNHADRTGRTPLSWAAEAGHIEIVKYLMSLKNLRANAPDRNGRTAISWAAGSGQLESTIYLRRTRTIDLGQTDNDGRNALSWASAGKHHKVVEYLIKHDPEGVDKEDADGWTPISWAMLHDAPKTVQTLLSSGLVDVNKKDPHGKSLLQFAAGYGYMRVVKIFLGVEGIQLDSVDNNGNTAISAATANGHTEIVQALEEAMR